MLIPGKNKPEQDIVYTPEWLVKQIINDLPIEGKVLDASAGDGVFFDNYPDYCEKDWCEIDKGRDFFEYTNKVDWIVTNPPWSMYRKFSQHAYTIADNVAFLVTINHDLALRARYRDMFEANFGIKKIFLYDTPKENWPQSGFQLGVVWKQRGYKNNTYAI